MEQPFDINLSINLWSYTLTFILFAAVAFGIGYAILNYGMKYLFDRTSKIIFEPILRACLAK